MNTGGRAKLYTKLCRLMAIQSRPPVDLLLPLNNLLAS